MLPCHRRYPQSIPQTAGTGCRDATGTCHCPRDSFPTTQLLRSSHTSRSATQTFPIPGCLGPWHSSQKPLPTQEPLGQLLCCPGAARSSPLTRCPPRATCRLCPRRGFGKEAAANHSCGWDVVSILSPSFLLPKLYQTSTRTRAARLPLQEVQRPQRLHQLGLAAH